MNRPCYRTIRELSPNKPTLIFVASRRQTRLTAFDLISYAAYDSEPKQFLNCSETYIEAVAETIRDEALRHTIAFGIGLHHAGLSSHDRSIVEKMYLKGELLVLVATATLAWGINRYVERNHVGQCFLSSLTLLYQSKPSVSIFTAKFSEVGLHLASQ